MNISLSPAVVGRAAAIGYVLQPVPDEAGGRSSVQLGRMGGAVFKFERQSDLDDILTSIERLQRLLCN